MRRHLEEFGKEALMGRVDHAAARLDLAGTREFGDPDAGPQRRERMTRYAVDLLGGLWNDACKEFGQRVRDGLALAAVGSLGRGDAGPLSDYDLILVHDGRTISGADVSRFADLLWYPLWDSGIRLDHSVRTLGECRTVAGEDLAAAVGLLDVRHMAGDKVLTAGVHQAISHDWRANARTRLPELVENVRARHDRHGDLATSLSPDLKEARGGLRDVVVLKALTAAWLADRPRGAVDEAHESLLDVRDALHVVTGRSREVLVLEEQDAVASLLGHVDSDELLTEVVESGRRIANALDTTMRRAVQSQRARRPRIGPRRPTLKPLGYGLYESDGEVVLGPNTRPAVGDHLLLMRAARIAAEHGLPMSPTTISNLSGTLAPVGAQWSPALRDAFVDLLASGPGLRAVWESLDLAGVIPLWIPEWRAVRSRPQRSSVHRFTVDRHLVETVVQATELRADVARPDLLLVAALLHDIGKIPGVLDHSVEGAPVAATIVRRMGFDPAEVVDVERLVLEHLTLVELATRRDPQDPATVESLLAAIDEREDLLDILAALTRSDAIAAGPKAWTTWRSQLVGALVEQARSRLTGATPTVQQEPAADGEIADLARQVQRTSAPAVHITLQDGLARIVMAEPDRAGLLADNTGLLASAKLHVRSARVHTVDGIAVNEWWVEAPFAQDVPAPSVLERGMKQLAAGDRTPLLSLKRRRAHAAKAALGQSPARATVVPGASADATVVEVRSPDRPGLLVDLAGTLSDHGLVLRSAHVATYAGQTLDTFYVTEPDGSVLAPHRAAELIGAMIDACAA